MCPELNLEHASTRSERYAIRSATLAPCRRDNTWACRDRSEPWRGRKWGESKELPHGFFMGEDSVVVTSCVEECEVMVVSSGRWG